MSKSGLNHQSDFNTETETAQSGKIPSIFLMGGVHLYGAVCFFVFGLFYWFLLHSAYMFISNSVFACLCVLNWLVYRKVRKNGNGGITRDITRDMMMATVFLIIVYVGLINVVVHLGINDSPLIYWGISVVVAAAFVYKIRGILIWVVLGLAFFPLTLFLKRNWFSYRVIPLDSFQAEFLNRASYFGILLFIGFMFYLFQKKLAHTLGSLKKSEEEYHGIFSAALDAIVVFNQDSLEIYDVNPAFCELYGYRREEVLGLRVPDISAEPEKTIVTIQAHSLRVNNRFHKKKNGMVFPVEISASYFSDNAKLYAVGIIRDVSERAHVEKERERLFQAECEARIEAHRANQSKDVFLATLSHELRTPLTAIQTWAQLLRMGRLDSAKTQHGIEAIEKSALAQGRIINDLLDISRIIMGKLQLEITEINPVSAVNDAVDSVRLAAEEKFIVIQSVFAPELRPIFADLVRLKQIVWNLLSNAIKFSAPKSKISVRVEVSNGPWLRITVSDEGKGIPAEVLGKIFDPFIQADSSSVRAHGGLGIGLTIVRTLVELHGGSVTVDSAGAGKGATFTVLIPFKAMAQDGINDEMPPSKIGEIDLKDIKILVVDDEVATCDALYSLLHSFGAEVKCVTSAADALKLLPEFFPRVLVSDIAMPEEDGYSLIHKIRTLMMPEVLRTVPAIALTAYAGQEEKRRVLEAGFQMHLEKPIDSAVLLQAIAGLSRQLTVPSV